MGSVLSVGLLNFFGLSVTQAQGHLAVSLFCMEQLTSS
jgi:hypothetical protein